MPYVDVPMELDVEPVPNPAPGLFDNVPGLEAPRPLPKRKPEPGQLKALTPVTSPLFAVTYELSDSGAAGLTLGIADIAPEPALCAPVRKPTQEELDSNLVRGMHDAGVLGYNTEQNVWTCEGVVLPMQRQLIADQLHRDGKLPGYFPEPAPAPTPQETVNTGAKLVGGLFVLNLHRTGQLGYLKAEDAWCGAQGTPLPDDFQAAANELVRGGHLPGYGHDAEPAQAGEQPAPESEPDLVITHSGESGTLLLGSRKGDGAYDALRGIGQRWRTFRTAADHGYPSGTLYVPQTRDTPPNRYKLERAAEALRAAGFTVAVEIDAKPRDEATVRADKRDRLEDRAEALTNKAARRAGEADARFAASDRIGERFFMGQPILVGHHSERGARRDQERMHNHTRKGIELHNQATETARRAEATEHNLATMDTNPFKIARRIETLEADLRRIDRGLNGHTRRSLNGKGEPVYIENHKAATGAHRDQLLERREHVESKLAYDRGLLEQFRADGKYNPMDRSKVKKGDEVLVGRKWYVVVRANPKTVSVQTEYSWTDKVPYDRVKDVRPGTRENPDTATA